MTDEQYPWLTQKIESSLDDIFFHDVEDLPDEAQRDKQSLRQFGIKTMLLLPFRVGDNFLGTIAFGGAMAFVRRLARQRSEQARRLADQLADEIARSSNTR